MKAQRYGIDIPDFRNTVVLSDDELVTLQQSQRRFVIVEYTYHDHFIAQVQKLKAWQFDVSSYNFLYWAKSDAEILTTAPNSVASHLDALMELRSQGIELGWWRPDGTFVPPVMFDAETDPAANGLEPLPTRTVPLVASAVEWAASEKWGRLASGIYTGEYWWRQNAGDDNRFASLPLWHASQYPSKPQDWAPVPFDSWFAGHQYGGWAQPQLWQYRDQLIGTVNCDWTVEEWEETAA